MKLRKLTPNDDKAVITLVQSTMGEEVGQHCVQAFKECSDTPDRILWGMFKDEDLVAVGGVYNGFYSKLRGYVSWFAVANSHQRDGLGSYMMEHVEKLAKEKGWKWLYVETYDNETFRKANNFYRKMGFKFAGSLKNYLDDGSDAIYYVKELS